jgi:major tropism determinant Mtd-like protein
MTTTAVQLQHRRGSSAQVATFTGAQGEVVVDTTNNRLVLQDGATAGGWSTAKLSEVPNLYATLTGVNFNSVADNAITIPLPPGFSTYLVAACYIVDASQTLTTATCGLFSATGAGGTPIITSGSSITVNTASANTNNNSQSLTINDAGTRSYNYATLYFRVQNAQGSAATANVLLVITPLF